MRWEVKDGAEWQKVARFILDSTKQTILAFHGEMGAGKTTLIKAICRELNCTEEASSPTFGIINEYLRDHGEPVCHFDFYRLEEPREALDLGVEEYFESGHLCLIEWPERIGSILPQEAMVIRIKVVHSTRIIEMEI